MISLIKGVARTRATIALIVLASLQTVITTDNFKALQAVSERPPFPVTGGCERGTELGPICRSSNLGWIIQVYVALGIYRSLVASAAVLLTGCQAATAVLRFWESTRLSFLRMGTSASSTRFKPSPMLFSMEWMSRTRR